MLESAVPSVQNNQLMRTRLIEEGIWSESRVNRVPLEPLETLDPRDPKDTGEILVLMVPMEFPDPQAHQDPLDRRWTASTNCIPCKIKKKLDLHSDPILFKLKWDRWDLEDPLAHLEILVPKVCLV